MPTLGFYAPCLTVCWVLCSGIPTGLSSLRAATVSSPCWLSLLEHQYGRGTQTHRHTHTHTHKIFLRKSWSFDISKRSIKVPNTRKIRILLDSLTLPLFQWDFHFDLHRGAYSFGSTTTFKVFFTQQLCLRTVCFSVLVSRCSTWKVWH